MKKYISLGMVAALLVTVPTSPALARAHSDNQDRGQPTTQQPDQSRDSASQQDGQRGQTSREDAEQRRERIQEEVEERRAEVKQQVCERKQEQLQRVIPKLATQARALKDAMDRVYENVQGFVEDEQVVVEGYEEHKNSVDAAQADAEAAVQVVEDYEFELDCDNPNVGEQLDGFRTAAEEARQELQEYRDELVHLIQEMRAEEAENTEGEQNGQTNNANGANNTADEGVENAQ